MPPRLHRRSQRVDQADRAAAQPGGQPRPSPPHRDRSGDSPPSATSTEGVNRSPTGGWPAGAAAPGRVRSPGPAPVRVDSDRFQARFDMAIKHWRYAMMTIGGDESSVIVLDNPDLGSLRAALGRNLEQPDRGYELFVKDPTPDLWVQPSGSGARLLARAERGQAPRAREPARVRGLRGPAPDPAAPVPRFGPRQTPTRPRWPTCSGSARTSSADADAVKTRYRELALRFHPDRHDGEPGHLSRFLGDPGLLRGVEAARGLRTGYYRARRGPPAAAASSGSANRSPMPTGSPRAPAATGSSGRAPGAAAAPRPGATPGTTARSERDRRVHRHEGATRDRLRSSASTVRLGRLRTKRSDEDEGRPGTRRARSWGALIGPRLYHRSPSGSTMRRCGCCFPAPRARDLDRPGRRIPARGLRFRRRRRHHRAAGRRRRRRDPPSRSTRITLRGQGAGTPSSSSPIATPASRPARSRPSRILTSTASIAARCSSSSSRPSSSWSMPSSRAARPLLRPAAASRLPGHRSPRPAPRSATAPPRPAGPWRCRGDS